MEAEATDVAEGDEGEEVEDEDATSDEKDEATGTRTGPGASVGESVYSLGVAGSRGGSREAGELGLARDGTGR